MACQRVKNCDLRRPTILSSTIQADLNLLSIFCIDDESQKCAINRQHKVNEFDITMFYGTFHKGIPVFLDE